jgi:hypothetical protein
MNYVRAPDTERFQGWANLSFEADAQRGSIIGIGAYLHPSIQFSLDQLLWVRQQGADGFFIYDWGSEVNGNKQGETRQQFYRELKKQVTPTWVDTPQTAWKANPIAGIVEGTVTSDGKPVDHARIVLAGQPGTETVTDGSGWYAVLNVEPGSYTLRVSMRGMRDVEVPIVVQRGGQIVTRDVRMTPLKP